MSKKRRNRGQDTPNPGQPLLPLSPGTAEMGIGAAFGADGEQLRSTLLRFNRNQHAAQFFASISLLRLSVQLMPLWEPTGTFARSDPSLVVGGAAIFMACIDQEAIIKNSTVSPLEMADRKFYLEGRSGWKGHASNLTFAQIKSGAPDLAKRIVEEASAFDMVETEFCTQMFVGMGPELGYSNKERHDQVLGASMLYHLYQGRYERLERVATN